MSDFLFNLQILRDGQPVGSPVGLEVPMERGAEALRWRHLCEGSGDLPWSAVAMTPVWKKEGPPEVEAVQFSTKDGKHPIRLDARKL